MGREGGIRIRCVALDVETSIIPVFLPWQPGAFLVCLSTCDEDGNTRTWFFEHEAATMTQRQAVEEINEYLSGFDRVIAHNLKFDLEWATAMGIELGNKVLWCTLVVEYLIRGHEKIQHLSLDALSEYYNLPAKKDKVKVYWDAGVQTDDIPADILQVYCEQDAANAMMIYRLQTEKARPLYKLISLEMEALKAFADMERNGMRVDIATVLNYQREAESELRAMDSELLELLGIDNLDSPQQKARGLFGGTEKISVYEDVVEDGVPVKYKTGQRAGQVKQRKVEREVYREGIGFDPVALKIPTTDSGSYSTDKAALVMLKGKTPEQKRVVELLQKRSPLIKLKTGYFDAIPRLEIDGYVHGNLNQALTKTGRLSCNAPNLQNVPSRNNAVKLCFVTRF